MNTSIMPRVRALFAVLSLMASTFACAAEPALRLEVGPAPQTLSRDALLANPAARTISVPADTAYHRAMRYRAVPLATLIPDLAQTGSVQFTANDGFVANIPGALLAGPGQAWLAIEPAATPWPPLKMGGPSAGPFYLVWLSPEKAGISPEQWPYQIAKIAIAAPLEVRYPQLRPNTAADSSALRGMHVYAANCATCHQINGAGDAAVGPDLNRPYSPTEYFQEAYLRKLIRNPADVRNWGQRVMPGFSVAALSEADVDDLLAYLRQMARQREK
jgi:mono/diheme cytochrome c family protein